METYQFERLSAWQKAKELAIDVYRLVAKFPQFEQYALSSQLRRSVISVPSNIAEGTGRISNKEKIHFLEISYGSLLETYCQLQIAVELSYLTKDDLEEVKPLFFETSRFQIVYMRRIYGQLGYDIHKRNARLQNEFLIT